MKTDGRDAGALCQRLSRFVDGNRKELALVRVPSEEEERLRAEHRQRESLVRAALVEFAWRMVPAYTPVSARGEMPPGIRQRRESRQDATGEREGESLMQADGF